MLHMATRLGLTMRETGAEQRGERKRGKVSKGKQRRDRDRQTDTLKE